MSGIRLHLEAASTLRERVVVTAAPRNVVATAVMVEMWRDGLAPHLQVIHRFGSEIARFGTPGEGLGVVEYRIAGYSKDGDHYELERVA